MSSPSRSELSHEDAAAMLWRLHAKRLITLEPSEVRWLEVFLGDLRVRYETVCDPELFADKNTKLLAATVLLDMAHNHMLIQEPDSATVMGLYQMVGQGATENMYRLSASYYQTYYSQIFGANGAAASQSNAQGRGLLVSSPRGVLPGRTDNASPSTSQSSANVAGYAYRPYFFYQPSSAGMPQTNPWHAGPPTSWSQQ
ncbi:hypothetical protein C8Q79DRAFT_1011885 [Trametes meyenii]|nr:hypothetical protein C8Q79DRAFT_1011885 [Trametes meyenii]